MTEETKIHFDQTDVLARAHQFELKDGFVKTSDWQSVDCDACRLERPAEKAPEYRVPADVLQRDAEVGCGDLVTFRLARLKTFLAETENAEEYAVRMIREFAALLTDAIAVKARVTARIETLRASQGAPVAQGAAGPARDAQALSGAFVVRHHVFEVGAGGTGCEAPDLGGEDGRCGRPASDPVHAYVIKWEDIQAMYARMTPQCYRQAPVNAVDIQTDAGQNEGMTNLSDAAVTALLSAPGNKVGAPVPGPVGQAAALRELRDAGLIGAAHGLTVKGSIERERRVAARLDDAFGS